MTISIADENDNVTDFYFVPHKVGKTIIELLYEYKDVIQIVSEERSDAE